MGYWILAVLAGISGGLFMGAGLREAGNKRMRYTLFLMAAAFMIAMIVPATAGIETYTHSKPSIGIW
jgi:hypothetical protein